MQRYALCALLAASLAVTAAPGALANDAGHTYEYDEAIDVFYPGAYVIHDAHDYQIHQVDEGTQITATLTWEPDPTVDMDVAINGPGDACDIVPPAIFCNVDLVTSLVDRADCEGGDEPRGTTATTAEVSVVTDRPGTWTVQVASTLTAPAQTVPYELAFSVSEDHGDVLGPQPAAYISSTGHCSTVE